MPQGEDSVIVPRSNVPIDAVKTLTESSYVMTGSKSSASINVWTSTLGLKLAGGFNFRKQAYEKDLPEKLYITNLVKVFDEKGATVYVHAKLAQTGSLKTMAEELVKRDSVEESKEEGQPDGAAPFTPPGSSSPINSNANKDDPFGGLVFDALFDESNQVPIESGESDLSCDSEDEFNELNFQNVWVNSKNGAQVVKKLETIES